MNEMDLYGAFTDIEDDLLLDAKKPIKYRHGIPTVIRKIGAVAAVLCLLSVSAMAVSFGVRIMESEERVPIGHFSFMGMFAPSSKITTVDYSLEAQKIDLPKAWEENLTEEWERFAYDHRYFKGVDLRDQEGKRINFHGISEIKEALGLSVVSSAEMGKVVKSAFVKLVVTDPERAGKEFADRGEITPDGIEIYFPFETVKGGKLDPQTVDYCGLYLYIPLTESFADQYRSHVVLSGVGNQDLKEEKYVSEGGVEVALLSNTISKEEPMQVYAAWEHEGIGYLLEMRTYMATEPDKEPVDMILPYLEHLEVSK